MGWAACGEYLCLVLTTHENKMQAGSKNHSTSFHVVRCGVCCTVARTRISKVYAVEDRACIAHTKTTVNIRHRCGALCNVGGNSTYHSTGLTLHQTIVAAQCWCCCVGFQPNSAALFVYSRFHRPNATRPDQACLPV